MAKAIYVCTRNKFLASIEKRLHDICNNLAPDNISPPTPKVVINRNIAYGIMDPISSIVESGNSLLMGQLFEKNDKWGEPLQDFPDGSYALFRDGKEYCEIVSDPIGSRAIWYYMDKEIFVSSTSQRAITMFIGSFEFDERVIPWILSSGSLGPSLSWDKRIERVPVDSSVILDKNKWSISKKLKPIEFNLSEESDEQHEKLIREALENTFESLNLDYSSWVLPLSGGYDSRGIFCLIRNVGKNIEHLKTITWGLESSLHAKGNDAYIAKELVNTLKVSNKYYPTDLSSEESIDKIINRFVLCGEGRIDHLSGYMDGFKLWKTLFEDRVQGVIRGDEAFGWLSVSSPVSVRHSVGWSLCSDFSNLKNCKDYGFATQELPQYFHRKEGETLATWRDRLFQIYGLPTIWSSLSDLKLSYVELINPLLSRKILQQVRQLPDHLRTKKALFKKIVTSLSPRVDFATKDSGANASLKNILRQKKITNLLKKELSSNNAKSIFPAEFLDYILKGIKTERQAKTTKSSLSSLKASIIRIVPGYIKNAIRGSGVLPSVDHNRLAFRVFLINRMNAILNDDSTRVSS